MAPLKPRPTSPATHRPMHPCTHGPMDTCTYRPTDLPTYRPTDLQTYFISSTTLLSSSGISGIGSRDTFIVPSEARDVCTLTVPHSAACDGKSSRKCPPRLS